MTDRKPVQDYYDVAVCYGCGHNNEHGHHVQTFWDGEIGHATFLPKPYHLAFPGVVYGGLIASIIDCHSMAVAIAAIAQAEGRTIDSDPRIICVTGNLNISFKKPTPIGHELKLEGRIKEMSDKKAIVLVNLIVNDEISVVGETVAVRVSQSILSQYKA